MTVKASAVSIYFYEVYAFVFQIFEEGWYELERRLSS